MRINRLNVRAVVKRLNPTEVRNRISACLHAPKPVCHVPGASEVIIIWRFINYIIIFALGSKGFEGWKLNVLVQPVRYAFCQNLRVELSQCMIFADVVRKHIRFFARFMPWHSHLLSVVVLAPVAGTQNWCILYCQMDGGSRFIILEHFFEF